MISRSNTESVLPAVIEAMRAACKLTLPEQITPEHGFVTDLGFDSMSIARLALELEDRVQQAVLLDDWIASEPDPTALTVGSLCNYVASLG
ncbi:MAG TPA: phosphopantetheine-binding protein [Myxococcus sp.]|jgi:acyl carrier protein|nr:phosphopantetheine-binding protein [Myxococcus sp.]